MPIKGLNAHWNKQNSSKPSKLNLNKFSCLNLSKATILFKTLANLIYTLLFLLLEASNTCAISPDFKKCGVQLGGSL